MKQVVDSMVNFFTRDKEVQELVFKEWICASKSWLILRKPLRNFMSRPYKLTGVFEDASDKIEANLFRVFVCQNAILSLYS